MGLKFIDNIVGLISDIIGVPFGLINRYLSNPVIRLWYGLITGIIMQYQLYGLSLLHIVFATFYSFLFVKFFGRKLSPFYVIAFNIIHLSYLQLTVMFGDYGKWSLSVETCYMMSICKFSSIAFNYEDGGKEEKEIKSSYQREKLIKEKPTLLETFSFIFYFPSALIGPSFEFRDFIKFIHLEEEYKHIPWEKANKAALREFVIAVLLVLIKVLLSPFFNTLYCGTEEFIQHNIFYKYFYMVFAMIVMRSTYYSGWKISQAGMNFSGLSYNKNKLDDKENSDYFDKIDNCNLEKIELDINPRIRIQYWNRTVHLWLKYYLFLRVINIDKKPFKNNKALASLLTFLVSAIWHGFYPVYYVFFFEYYMIEQIATYFEEEYDLFNKIEKWSFFPKLAYRIFIMSVVNYFGLAFSILTLRANWNYYKAFHFVPLLSLFVSWVYTKIAKKSKRKNRNVETIEKKENVE